MNIMVLVVYATHVGLSATKNGFICDYNKNKRDSKVIYATNMGLCATEIGISATEDKSDFFPPPLTMYVGT